jgi:hypothetical protein
MPVLRTTLLALACLGSACLVSDAAGDPETQLRSATLTVGGGRCAGVVVGSPRVALTSAHCIVEGEDALGVELWDGTRLEATVRLLDRPRDVAVLELSRESGVTPLRIAPNAPGVGEPLRFAGRNDYDHAMQDAELLRLGRCPSLPSVPAALFTTLRGVPGDSGAPVVDHLMRVVGLVHGGAACHIAAPVHEFAAVVGAASRGG